MNWKLIFTIIATIFGVVLAFYLLGILISWLSYFFWFAVVGGVAYGGYRLYKAVSKPELQPKPTAFELDFDESQRTLEEYKQKYLK
jgi:hypothetical protein